MDLISMILVIIAAYGFIADTVTIGTCLYVVISKIKERRTVSCKDDSSDDNDLINR